MPNARRGKAVALFIALLALGSGCVRLHHFAGIKPVFPACSFGAKETRIETLEPVLRWTAVPGATSYEVAVWRASIGSSPCSSAKAWSDVGHETPVYKLKQGELVHHFKDVAATEYKLPKLLPDTVYYWSVRVSGPDEEWSTYDVSVITPGVVQDANRCLYGFHTPPLAAVD